MTLKKLMQFPMHTHLLSVKVKYRLNISEYQQSQLAQTAVCTVRADSMYTSTIIWCPPVLHTAGTAYMLS